MKYPIKKHIMTNTHDNRLEEFDLKNTFLQRNQKFKTIISCTFEVDFRFNQRIQIKEKN